ncbi:hypothetical protein BDC45DRAFT_533907 [Circinella umbellata]|nr:hypothetical protein BDC45DRAFT_533907 [Circinella umbellata]
MGEVIEAAEPHHVVITELDIRNDKICSHVPLTRTAYYAKENELRRIIGSVENTSIKTIINLIDTIQNITLSCAPAARMLCMPECTGQDCFACVRDSEEDVFA